MQLISKFNKELCFLLCVTDIFSKYLLFAGKFVIPKRFIRTFKIKMFKCLNSIWKNVYIDKLDDRVNKYSNTYHSTIKMKPVNVKFNTHLNSSNSRNY